MTLKLPPLNSLKAFVVVARLKSFTKAAQALGVTQGAISKQIKILEEFLGTPLFERDQYNFSITKKGEEYYLSINKALDIIEESTAAALKKSKKPTLKINILPSFINRCLPLLTRDLKDDYDLTVEIGAGYDPVDFIKNEADIALRIVASGKGQNNCKIVNLFPEKLICVASPKYLSKRPKIKTIDDLKKHMLLGNSSRPFLWKRYLRFLGFKKFEPNFKLEFEHFFMMIDAAKIGLGLAMVTDFLVEDEIKNGNLVKVFEEAFPTGYYHQLLYPKQKHGNKKINDFIKWARHNIR